MALPPSDSANFEREVDENYRRDRMADFGKTYGKWIVLGVILFLAAIGGFIYWQHSQKIAAGEQAEELAKVQTDFVAGKTDGLDGRLAAVAADSDGATKAAALMTQAAMAVGGGDREKAVGLYREIAADKSMPQPYRDAALVREVQFQFDQMEPADVIAKLQPLAKPGEPFFGSAGEMTAAALLKMGRDQEAGQLFAQLAGDAEVPNSIKARSRQMATSLGVQAPDVPQPSGQE